MTPKIWGVIFHLRFAFLQGFFSTWQYWPSCRHCGDCRLAVMLPASLIRRVLIPFYLLSFCQPGPRLEMNRRWMRWRRSGSEWVGGNNLKTQQSTFKRENLSGGLRGGLGNPGDPTKSVQFEDDITILTLLEDLRRTSIQKIKRNATTISKIVASDPSNPMAKRFVASSWIPWKLGLFRRLAQHHFAFA